MLFIPPEPLFHPNITAFQLQNEYIIRAERPLLPCKTITIAEQKESFGKAKVVLLQPKGAFLQLLRLHTLATIGRKPLCISIISLLAQNSRISGKILRRALNWQF